MFKVGDIVEITTEADATGMLDFEDGKGYAVLDVGFSSVGLLHIKLADESGRKFWHATSHFKLKEEAKVEKKECLFKKGQVVYCIVNGKGIVYGVSQSGDVDYPVKVDFENGEYDYYTIDGKLITSGTRTLFFSPPVVTGATEPLFEPVLGAGMILAVVDKETSRFCHVVVSEETEEHVESSHGVVFEKTLHDFYRLGEKIEFN